MSVFSVRWTDRALKQMRKLDKSISEMLLRWVNKNLVGCSNPRQHGKALCANRSGQWRYRVGDYRLIAEIEDEQIVILILSVGHRKDIYED